LFEYLAHGLPVLVPPNPLWVAEVQRHGAGLSFDFLNPAPVAQLCAALRNTRFYPSGLPREALWTTEGRKLRLLLDTLV
jgi:hypothetical protein